MHSQTRTTSTASRERGGEGSAPRVWVVEDDRDLREALGDVLRLEGFEVQLEQNGLDALLHLRSTARLPDVVLLDLDMPLMNGWEFRQAQLADPILSGIPVVVLSSHAEEGLPPGALPKPCAPERLLERLRAVLTEREWRRGAAEDLLS